MRRKLFPSIGIATTLIAVAQPLVSADTIDINTKSKAEYNPKQPATWRQLDTPFSNQYYTPSREQGATFGMAGCGAFVFFYPVFNSHFFSFLSVLLESKTST